LALTVPGEIQQRQQQPGQFYFMRTLVSCSSSMPHVHH
jgi:hypothetical protein